MKKNARPSIRTQQRLGNSRLESCLPARVSSPDGPGRAVILDKKAELACGCFWLVLDDVDYISGEDLGLGYLATDMYLAEVLAYV